MRVFFALPLSPSSSLQILHWRDKAFPRDRVGIVAENFHITLSFVGEVTSAQCDQIMQSANDLWQNKKPKALSLAIDQYAYWPNPGIFWIGPTIWPEPLQVLHSNLKQLSQRCVGRSAKQPFQPHISLYRTKKSIPQPLIAPDFQLTFDEVVLLESVTKKQGVYYRELAEWPLEQAFRQPTQAMSRPMPKKNLGGGT